MVLLPQLQPIMLGHDDLAALFSRNLSLNQPQPPEPKPEAQMIYSVSQHYHHSAHLARKEASEQEKEQHQQAQPQQRPSSLPPPESGPTAEQILTSHGIDSTVLSLAQIQLFKTADDAQKLRLLELWRICPPERNDTHDCPTLAWNTTTLDQEEALARIRYEQQQHRQEEAARQEQRRREQAQAMSLDGTLVPIQVADGRWIQLADSQAGDGAEPYMASGYERLARKEYDAPAQSRHAYSHFGTAIGGPNHVGSYSQATDPAYRQTMENQYGVFQMRGTCGIGDEMEVL